MVSDGDYAANGDILRSKLLGGLLRLESRSMGLETGLAGVSDAEFMAEVRRRDVEWRGEGL